MPRIIALLLCSTYVLILLGLEAKKNSNVSAALIIPTLWMLLIASKPLAVWFGVGGDPNEGSLPDRVFLTGLLITGLMVLMKRNFRFGDAIRSNRYLFALLGYMLISVLWSPIPFVSFKRWIRGLTAIIMALVVATEADPREALLCLFRRTIVILIPFSLLLIKYFPEYGVEYGRWFGERMWIGVTLQKNGLGRLSMFAAFYYIWSLFRRYRYGPRRLRGIFAIADLSVFIIALFLLKATPVSYSATAIVSFIGGLAVFLMLWWAKSSRIKPRPGLVSSVITGLVVFAIITVWLGGTTVASATSSLGRNATLTGRTDVWASLVPVFMQKPVLGAGFGSFWTEGSRVSFDIPDAHSGYLDVLLELGFVGMLLLTGFLVSMSRQAIKGFLDDFTWTSLCICLVIMSMIHNVSESSFNSLDSHLTAILQFLAVCSAGAGRAIRADLLRTDVREPGYLIAHTITEANDHPPIIEIE